MSNRTFFCFIGSSALIVGGSIYILCRQDSHITILLQNFTPYNISFFANSIFLQNISYYIPDFLWAFGLCCGLFAIFDSRLRTALICSVIAFTYGTIWEVLQCINVVNGTFDFWDILMYLTASVLATILYYKRRNKK